MRVSKSGLFLFELIVVIFLFTISSAVCISIFAKSFSYSTQSESLTMSSIKAETAAEVFKSGKGNAGSDAEAIIKALDVTEGSYDMIIDEGTGDYGDFTINIYYDEDWNITDDVNKVNTLTFSAANGKSYGNNEIIRAIVKTSDDRKEVFRMETSKIYGSKQAGSI